MQIVCKKKHGSKFQNVRVFSYLYFNKTCVYFLPMYMMPLVKSELFLLLRKNLTAMAKPLIIIRKYRIQANP